MNGAQGRNRTTDTRIFNPLLYQLSYLGILPDCGATRTRLSVDGRRRPPNARGL